MLNAKVSQMAMFIGCMVICLIIAGAVVQANNDSITVQNGGTVNINNGQAQPSDMLGGYTVNMTSSADVTSSFPGPVTLEGALTVAGAGTFSGANTFSATTTFTGNVQSQRVFSGGAIYSSSTSKAFTLAASVICDYYKISLKFVTSSADNVAITMPATSSVSSYCLKSEGQGLNLMFINASTFASSTTITANTDYNFYYNATSTAINGGKMDSIYCRRGASSYDCFFNQYPVR